MKSNMNFCEKCNLLNKGTTCNLCGRGNLREVKEDDFCFFVECSESLGKSLKNSFDNEGIPCALIPTGNGVRSLFGLKLENYRVYVPYGYYDKCVEIYSVLTGQVE